MKTELMEKHALKVKASNITPIKNKFGLLHDGGIEDEGDEMTNDGA